LVNQLRETNEIAWVAVSKMPANPQEIWELVAIPGNGTQLVARHSHKGRQQSLPTLPMIGKAWVSLRATLRLLLPGL
jgi:hypothetical protein